MELDAFLPPSSLLSLLLEGATRRGQEQEAIDDKRAGRRERPKIEKWKRKERWKVGHSGVYPEPEVLGFNQKYDYEIYYEIIKLVTC